MTVLAQLIASETDSLGYITYVFKRLDESTEYTKYSFSLYEKAVITSAVCSILFSSNTLNLSSINITLLKIIFFVSIC